MALVLSALANSIPLNHPNSALCTKKARQIKLVRQSQIVQSAIDSSGTVVP